MSAVMDRIDRDVGVLRARRGAGSGRGADRRELVHRLLPASGERPALATLAPAVQEEDVVGDHLDALALGAVLGLPLTPGQAAVDADAPSLGQIGGGGLGLTAEDRHVEVVGAVTPVAGLIARARGHRKAHRADRIPATGVAQLGIAREAPHQGDAVQISGHLDPPRSRRDVPGILNPPSDTTPRPAVTAPRRSRHAARLTPARRPPRRRASARPARSPSRAPRGAGRRSPAAAGRRRTPARR